MTYKSKANAKTIDAKVRAAKAMKLRMGGLTFSEIADELGYNSYQSAHEAVRRALKETLRVLTPIET